VSRAADQAHAALFAAHVAECERTLVVGTPVYRAHHDRVEEGVVVRVARCYYTRGGDVHEVGADDPRGTQAYFVARFGDDEHEGQSYQWRWFADVQHARRRLIALLRDECERVRRQLARYEVLVAQHEAALPPGPAPWMP